MSRETPDLFCRIIAGEVAAARVVETDLFLAILDHRPVFKGHTLILPRRHVTTVADLPSSLMTPMLELAQRISRAQQESLDAQGSFMALNNIVSQSVPHLHFHVVPRTKGDGLRGFFWPRTKYDDGEMAQYAATLAAAISA